MKIALSAKTYLMSRKNVMDKIKYYWTWDMIYYNFNAILTVQPCAKIIYYVNLYD